MIFSADSTLQLEKGVNTAQRVESHLHGTFYIVFKVIYQHILDI